MLPWTLASLINNTDMIATGVHLYIACDAGTEDRIQAALKNFDLPEDTIIDSTKIASDKKHPSKNTRSYRNNVLFNINYWAFRDESNTHKLPSEHIIVADSGVIEPYPDISQVPPEPQLYDMKSSTKAQFRHAIKHLLSAQLSMKV